MERSMSIPLASKKRNLQTLLITVALMLFLQPLRAQNVGIEITSPAAKLHVEQTAASDAFRVDDAASDVSPFIIDQSGNVGVGLTVPTAKLEINGDLFVNTSSSIINFNTLTGVAGVDRAYISKTLNGTFNLVNVDNTSMYLGTNNATRMTILSGGDVGIGTTTPTDGLEITSGGLFLNTSSSIVNFNTLSGTAGVDRAYITKFVNGTFDIYNVDNTSMNLGTNNITRLTIESGGDVGIGTIVPAEKLEIVGDLFVNNASSRIEFNSNTGFAGTDRAYIQKALNSAFSIWNVDNTNLDFGVNNVTEMSIESGGNIGMGISNPEVGLHWYGGNGPSTGAYNSQVKMAIEHSSGAYLEFNASGEQGISFNDDNVSLRAGVLFNSVSDYIHIKTGGVNNRITIEEGGDVGIGTSNPTSKLEIVGDLFINDASSAINFNTLSGGAGVDRAWIQKYANSSFYIYNYDNTNMYLGTNGSARMTITSAGFVGIGTTGPGAQLEVQRTSGTPLRVDRQGTDGTVVEIQNDGTTQGTISVSGATVSYNAFTGSHYGISTQEIEGGRLVRMTGRNKYLHDDEHSEIIYGIEESNKPNDHALLGTFLGTQESNDPVGTENPYLIMAVGNGIMLVADHGSDLEIGDYLISSAVSGHAMKEDGSYDMAYVVARVAEPIEWDKVTETVDGVKHTIVSVLFESFVKNNAAIKLSQANKKLDQLKSQMDKMEDTMKLLQGKDKTASLEDNK